MLSNLLLPLKAKGWIISGVLLICLTISSYILIGSVEAIRAIVGIGIDTCTSIDIVAWMFVLAVMSVLVVGGIYATLSYIRLMGTGIVLVAFFAITLQSGIISSYYGWILTIASDISLIAIIWSTLCGAGVGLLLVRKVSVSAAVYRLTLVFIISILSIWIIQPTLDRQYIAVVSPSEAEELKRPVTVSELYKRIVDTFREVHP